MGRFTDSLPMRTGADLTLISVASPQGVRPEGQGIEAGSFPYSGKWIVCLPKKLQHPLVA